MPWEPMPRDEAEKVLEQKIGSTDEAGEARILEALMVVWGHEPGHIRRVVEAHLERHLERPLDQGAQGRRFAS